MSSIFTHSSNKTFLLQSWSVPPKTPSLTSSASGIQQTGTKVTLTCKTTSPGSVTYKFYKSNSEIHISSSSGRSGSYVVPDTAGQNSFTCKAIISGVTSAASSSVSLKLVGKWKWILFHSCHLYYEINFFVCLCQYVYSKFLKKYFNGRIRRTEM